MWFTGNMRLWLLLLIVGLPCGNAVATPIVIGGSSGIAPPPFWTNSFWGMTSSIDRAFPFTVPAGGPYIVEEAQFAAYHYDSMPGDRATLSIHVDDGGIPGASLTTFQINGISTVAQVLASAPEDTITLASDTTYWFVGSTPYGQVNWNLGDNTFGTVAYRGTSGDWTVLHNRNVSAFAVLGSPVPEPSTLAMLVLSCGAFIRTRQ